MLSFLNEKGIAYTARDLKNDADTARTFEQLGGRGVPVIKIGSRVIHGYNPEAVMAVLN